MTKRYVVLTEEEYSTLVKAKMTPLEELTVSDAEKSKLLAAVKERPGSDGAKPDFVVPIIKCHDGPNGEFHCVVTFEER